MKKSGIFILMLLISISMISAGYECSDGNIIEDSKELELYEAKSINSVGVGLIYSDETAATQSYSAEIIVDAVKFILTEAENSTEAEMITETESVKMIEADDSKAKLKVGGDYEEISKGDTRTIDDFQVYLISSEGNFPNSTGNVEGIIGYDKIFLTRTDKENLVEIDGTEYVFELFAASDTNAIIKVQKCGDGNATFVEIAEPVVNDTETINNNTEDEIENSSVSEEQNNASANDSIEVNSTEADISGESEKSIAETVVFAGIIFAAVVVFIFLVLILLRKKEQTGFNLKKFEEDSAKRKEAGI